MAEEGEDHRRRSLVDYTTLLPPRKRLLAGLKKRDNGHDLTRLPLPIRFGSGDLQARVDELLDLNDLSLEEVIEASKLIASAAATAAAKARAVALDKAEAAIRAKVFAKSVLDLVGPVCGNEIKGDSSVGRKRDRKKHVEVEILYKTNSELEVSQDDEELARRLHQSINSSPRISRQRKKRHENSMSPMDSNGVTTCIVNSIMLCREDTILANQDRSSNTENEKLLNSKQIEMAGGASCSQNQSECITPRVAPYGKKIRIKVKKLI